jgi:2-dehydro-3-deoxygluconokinase
MRIVCIGECMVELAPQPAPQTYVLGYAGDTFNTAWYLRKMLPQDVAVDYLTALGTDQVSQQMLAKMQADGIGTDHIARLAGYGPGLYMIHLQNGERSFTYWRGQSAARQLAADPDHLARALRGADMAYLSGITLGILSPTDRATLRAALAAFRQAGGQVAFDPNLRPRLWPDNATMCAAVMEMAGQADIALPSHEDEAAAFGDADLSATLARYTQAGVRDVIVKNGPGPMLARIDGAQITLTPDRVTQICDTTAAGDSFNAGYLAAKLRGAGAPAALATGATLAARVIAGRGALVDVGPWPDLPESGAGDRDTNR